MSNLEIIDLNFSLVVQYVLTVATNPMFFTNHIGSHFHSSAIIWLKWSLYDTDMNGHINPISRFWLKKGGWQTSFMAVACAHAASLRHKVIDKGLLKPIPLQKLTCHQKRNRFKKHWSSRDSLVFREVFVSSRGYHEPRGNCIETLHLPATKRKISIVNPSLPRENSTLEPSWFSQLN